MGACLKPILLYELFPMVPDLLLKYSQIRDVSIHACDTLVLETAGRLRKELSPNLNARSCFGATTHGHGNPRIYDFAQSYVNCCSNLSHRKLTRGYYAV